MNDRDPVRRFARRMLTLAVRGRRRTGGPWGEAALAEFDRTRGRWQAVRWASGGVRTAWRERRHRNRRRPLLHRHGLRFAVGAVLAAVATVLLIQFAVRPGYTADVTMEPTFAVSDRWLLDRVSFHVDGIHHGDVVVYKRRYANVDRMHRVIGLAGDSIECRDGRVHLNGAALDEPYLAPGTRTECDPTTVPAGSLYVRVARGERMYDEPDLSVPAGARCCTRCPVVAGRSPGRPVTRTLPSGCSRQGLNGIGPSGPARLIGDIGDIHRLANRGTATCSAMCNGPRRARVDNRRRLCDPVPPSREPCPRTRMDLWAHLLTPHGSGHFEGVRPWRVPASAGGVSPLDHLADGEQRQGGRQPDRSDDTGVQRRCRGYRDCGRCQRHPDRAGDDVEARLAVGTFRAVDPFPGDLDELGLQPVVGVGRGDRGEQAGRRRAGPHHPHGPDAARRRLRASITALHNWPSRAISPVPSQTSATRSGGDGAGGAASRRTHRRARWSPRAPQVVDDLHRPSVVSMRRVGRSRSVVRIWLAPSAGSAQ